MLYDFYQTGEICGVLMASPTLMKNPSFLATSVHPNINFILLVCSDLTLSFHFFCILPLCPSLCVSSVKKKNLFPLSSIFFVTYESKVKLN